MKNLLLIVSIVFTLLCTKSPGADPADAKAGQLATDVWKASGGENWTKVKSLRFTFGVEQQGKTLFGAEHNWDVSAWTDEVKWKEKHVTVNLVTPAPDEDAQKAYARWVNDSYWLLAPLKVRDRGVILKYEGVNGSNGSSFETLRLSFDQVGLTPSDQYLLYIDPKTKLVRAWDYVPKTGESMHATWDKYETHGGLNLSTEHRFDGKMIRFSGIEMTVEK